MIQVDTKAGLGNIGVATTDFKGHSPEFWAERCTARICGISDNAAPHIRQQAEAYRLAIYEQVLYHIKQAINSHVVTMNAELTTQGHEDMAKIIKEL
tara:strand:- start:563 stop:853 length:291 start_codon:yes stop_codon:yes gene_type:complete